MALPEHDRYEVFTDGSLVGDWIAGRNCAGLGARGSLLPALRPGPTENSIPIQQDQVRAWAKQHGVEIIHEFCDAGRSGLNSEGRPAFTEMMDEWITQRDDFEYVLCLDVSGWGRFQDIDLSAQFSAICKKHKKQVIYTTIGKPREDDPPYPVYVQFERFHAAQYSRELSDKVWRG